MLKKKWLWIVVFAYIGFIFFNSLQVGESSGNFSKEIALFLMNTFHVTIDFDSFHHFIRKLAHFSEYFILALLVTGAIHVSPLFQNKKMNLLVFWILPPSVDETIQHFVPGRNGAFSDVLLDMSGFFVGFCILYLILHHKRKAH